MASTGKKWAIGCGIGCGFIILVTALVGGGLFFAVKDVIDEAKTIEKSNDALVEAYGEVEDFTPAADGSIAPERMEIFLAVREAMTEPAQEFADLIHLLDDDDGVEVEANALDKIKAVMTIPHAAIRFLNQRNERLLEQGMGDGEYTYIYSMAYFGYLDKEVADGPSVKISGEDDSDGASFRFGNDSQEQSKEEREREIRRHLARLHRTFLDNQIVAAGEDPVLLAEREALMSNSRRLLWEEGLPEAIRASIVPYAAELEMSYIPILNLVEVGMVSD